jgi:hypothetical protein
MPSFSPANIAAMIKKLRAMAAARQVTVTLKRDERPDIRRLGDFESRFGNGLEFVLILDTEWGFLEKFPKGPSPAQRLQRSSSKAAFELSLRLCKKGN